MTLLQMLFNLAATRRVQIVKYRCGFEQLACSAQRRKFFCIDKQVINPVCLVASFFSRRVGDRKAQFGIMCN